MFNGIIYNQGIIRSKTFSNKSCLIELKSKLNFNKSEIGSSVSCNGVCLTITKVFQKNIFFYLSNETLKRTNLLYARRGNYLNLEKSLNYGNKISGHYVQGHVDKTAKVLKIKKESKCWTINFSINKKDQKYIVEKGSIAINGVSLTIANIKKNLFTVVVIPQTLKLTNIINLKKNDFVNVEFDIFSKYLIKLNN